MRTTAALLGLLAAGCAGSPPPPLRVAAAADLGVVMPAIIEAFRQQTAADVVVTSGASGQLAHQLAQGAPFDLFLSANTAFVDDVVARGACDGAIRAPYARGRLAIVTRHGLAAATSLPALSDPRFTRVGIANPEHAPYGQAARAALASAGVLDKVAPRLVFGDNVRQALQLVQSGNVDAAIVSHALTDGLELPFVPVDEALHPPLVQALAVCGRGPRHDDATALARFILSPAGQALLGQHGFAPATTTMSSPVPMLPLSTKLERGPGGEVDLQP